jgi:crossover junction endodeoxyribonuclease RuvC
MVTRLLRMADPPRPADCADALALAICHLWRGPAQRRMNDAAARASQATSVMAARAAAQAKAQVAAQRAAAAARGAVLPRISAGPGGPR